MSDKILSFTQDSLAKALDSVQCLPDLGPELIAEQVFADIAQQPAASDEWKSVHVDPVQHLLTDALTAADLVRSGRRSKALADRLRERCSLFSAMLATAPAAPVAVGQGPVAWVLLHNGVVAYDRDEAIISNVPGDCIDESYEWRPVYTAPPAAAPAPAPAQAAQDPVVWIGVDDRLPSDGDEVIVSGFAYNDPAQGRYVSAAVYRDDGFRPIDAQDDYDNLHPVTHWTAMPPAPGAEQPDSTTSDRYRAELYDEVWEKARSMGCGNVTEALAELERRQAAEQPDTVKVRRELLSDVLHEADCLLDRINGALQYAGSTGDDAKHGEGVDRLRALLGKEGEA